MSGPPRLGRLDSFRFIVGYVLPAYLQGLFIRNRFWTGLVARCHRDPLGITLMTRLRRRARAQRFYVQLGNSPTLVVLDEPGIRDVLNASPHVYADPSAKRRGMANFQPHALTISRGDSWRRRRAFNEAVLSTGGLHPLADVFLKHVRTLVQRHLVADTVTYDDLHTLCRNLSLLVVFGRCSPPLDEIPVQLAGLMRRANWVVLRPRRDRLANFQCAVEDAIRRAPEHCLAGLSRCHSYFQDNLDVVSQLTHWLFAMCETLPENLARAAVLVLGRSDLEERVRGEFRAATRAPGGKDLESLRFLSGCIQEAMRLWPTTPTLARYTVQAGYISPHVVPAGIQVMIPVAFVARDTRSDATLNQVEPDRHLASQGYRFNHLSNGKQACAGGDLILLLLKGILSAWLSARKPVLNTPRVNGASARGVDFFSFSVSNR